MPRTISIGSQSFSEIRERGYFFVDKTAFIRDWWQSGDSATLICRPRRFGKTLNMSMLECFFSLRYANRQELFDGLKVWVDNALRVEQGAWPVVNLSLGSIKASTFDEMRMSVRRQIQRATRACWQDGAGSISDPVTRELVIGIMTGNDDASLKDSLATLCETLWRATGRKTIVLLDEYDTPLQEAWLRGYWDQASEFMRGLLNATFKSNPFLERGLLMGITRIAHESIFSDLNNLKVATGISGEYATSFGFTEAEIFDALEEFGLCDHDELRAWYDGFSFGDEHHIYNPWSITNYLDTGKFRPYWANTSSNALVSSLVGMADSSFKTDFEVLLSGGVVRESINLQTVFPDLTRDPAAVWGLLVAGGYLKATEVNEDENSCDLSVTNHETMLAFDQMVRRWFGDVQASYNAFIKALLVGDINAMNTYMNDVALDTFSSFDAGNRPSGSEPERFYHGFVLGLLVELRGRYRVRSNRESGFGRYDIALEPLDVAIDPGIIIEFKVFDPCIEDTLSDTVARALDQIKKRSYDIDLIAAGVPASHIHEYGFAFEGKQVLIGQ